MTPEIREIAWIEPFAAFTRWAHEPGIVFLDSGGPVHERARFSYLAIEPFQVLHGAGGRALLDGREVEGEPLTVLARELARFAVPHGAGPAPFLGGVAGFIGYEPGARLERVPLRHPDLLGLDEWWLGFYDVIVAFDCADRRAWVLSSGFPLEGPERQSRAVARLQHVLDRLARPPEPIPAILPAVSWECELSRPDYERRVARVIDYICAGDIYQANFTGRHLARRPGGLDPAAAYQALRQISPAPFGAFVRCDERLALAGVSPERFIRLEADGTIETRPIKGTRPRGRNRAEDARLREALLSSEKDRAENLMIVDLLRNDIGRVAEVGSVRVDALWQLESFASVHHLVSAVAGQLARGRTAVDLLRATLPGGSITGAPKIRAMQIIDELEVARRGPYCGTVAWLGFDGAMDSSITIRTLVITPDWLVAQGGGGIVADSDPAEEFEEMIVKVSPLLLGGR